MTIKQRIMFSFVFLQVLGYSLLLLSNSFFIGQELKGAIDREVKLTLTGAANRIDHSYNFVLEKNLDISVFLQNLGSVTPQSINNQTNQIRLKGYNAINNIIHSSPEVLRVVVMSTQASSIIKWVVEAGSIENNSGIVINKLPDIYSNIKASSLPNLGTWSNAYIDETGTVVISHIISLKDEASKHIGYVQTDWDLRSIANYLHKIEVSRNAFTFWIDAESLEILSYIDGEVVSGGNLYENEFLEGFVLPDKSGDVNVLNQVYLNEELHSIYYIGTNSDLIFGVVIPDSDMKFAVTNILRNNFYTALIIILLFIFIAVYLTGLSFLPLSRIMNKVNDSIKRDPSTDSIKVENIEYNEKNEFTGVVKALNSVYETVNESITKINTAKSETDELNKALDKKVSERTYDLKEKTKSLESSLNQLQEAQKGLIESEKMASLGGLVAGVAHEINTPVGISVTAVTHLQSKVKEIEKKFTAKTLTIEDFSGFIEVSHESAAIIDVNLHRAAELIKSFKLVAVDQSSDERRVFSLLDYTKEVLKSLQPQIKKKQLDFEVKILPELRVNQCPGSFAQVITILVTNSLIHGFEGVNKGTIKITADLKAHDEVIFLYSDNGKGMSDDSLDRIFEPFYTTKRGNGGSGLGAHILYNIVTQVFKGTIEASNSTGGGLQFSIKFPSKLKLEI